MQDTLIKPKSESKLKSKLVTHNPIINAVFTLLVPTAFFFTMEWIHRGTLGDGFVTDYLIPKRTAFFLGWLVLFLLYVAISQISGCHWLATFIVGAISNAFGTVTFFMLQKRGEPFLPWTFSQIEDYFGVADKVSLQIQPPMIWTIFIFAALFVVSLFIRLPYPKGYKLVWRASFAMVSLAAGFGLIWGVFMVPSVTYSCGIISDMWMQDRYYKTNGIITGFFTNLVALKIDSPADYSAENVQKIYDQTEENAKTQKPLFEDSYGAGSPDPEQQPNIIYVMNESFWDVSRLEGITFDREITPNLTALKNEAAYGYVFTPSFGGGTCDVEFEALTGFSVSHLPTGSKPFQQYVTHDTASLPQYLRSEGYDTLAIHGYYRKFWSRVTAYPYLGFDNFIAAEDFVNPDRRRGFISDEAMTDRIISEYENSDQSKPLFIHAVTMQNHTTYDEDHYAADEIVQVLDSPNLSSETISQLKDFATGISEADAALGKLVDYFRTVDEPTIIVFWGDHFNPIGKGNELFENTGYIAKGDTGSPALRQTDLMMWSNYDSTSIDLGTVGAYELTPVMMDLYGIEKPTWFEFLAQEFNVMRARTYGFTVEPDNTINKDDLSEIQQKWYDDHWMLQYDMLLGKQYGDTITPAESAKTK